MSIHLEILHFKEKHHKKPFKSSKNPIFHAFGVGYFGEAGIEVKEVGGQIFFKIGLDNCHKSSHAKFQLPIFYRLA